MKKINSIAFSVIVLSACSAEKGKNVTISPTDQTSQSNVVDKAPIVSVEPTPVPAPTAAPAPKISSTYSLYTIPKGEAISVRSATKIVSIEVHPTKLISSIATIPSSIAVKCGEKLVSETQFEMTFKSGQSYNYRPSAAIFGDLVCENDIVISMKINGYEVELSDAAISDVIETKKPELTEK